MRVLMISIDRKIFESGSDAERRHIAYGGMVDELHIVVFTPPGYSARQLSAHTFVYPTNTAWKPFYFFDAYRLCREIIGHHKDTLVTIQDGLNNVLGAFLRFRYKIKLQLQVHDDIFNPRFVWESWRTILDHAGYLIGIRFADCIRVVSQRAARSVRRHILQIPTVLPIFIDTERIEKYQADFDLHEKFPQFKTIILTVSRLAYEKRIDVALHAFAKVHKTRDTVGLVIVGDGPLKQKLQNLAKRLGVETSVVFVGWQEDPLSYYKTSDIFLLTSNYEGYGRTLVEATAAGLPIVATDVGLVGEILHADHSVLSCPVADAACIAGKISLLIADSSLRDRLRENALKAIRSAFPSWEEYLVAYKESWESCRASMLR